MKAPFRLRPISDGSPAPWVLPKVLAAGNQRDGSPRPSSPAKERFRDALAAATGSACRRPLRIHVDQAICTARADSEARVRRCSVRPPATSPRGPSRALLAPRHRRGRRRNPNVLKPIDSRATCPRESSGRPRRVSPPYFCLIGHSSRAPCRGSQLSGQLLRAQSAAGRRRRRRGRRRCGTCPRCATPCEMNNGRSGQSRRHHPGESVIKACRSLITAFSRGSRTPWHSRTPPHWIGQGGVLVENLNVSWFGHQSRFMCPRVPPVNGHLPTLLSVFASCLSPIVFGFFPVRIQGSSMLGK